MGNPTVVEIQKARQELERDIIRLIQEFEAETRCSLVAVQLHREQLLPDRLPTTMAVNISIEV